MRITKRSFSTVTPPRLGIACANAALLSAYRKRLLFAVVFSPRHSLRKRGSALGLSKTFEKIPTTKVRLIFEASKFRRSIHCTVHPIANALLIPTECPARPESRKKSEELPIATESPPHAADRCPSCAFGFRIGRKSLSPHAKQSIQPTDEQPVAAFDSANFILYL